MNPNVIKFGAGLGLAGALYIADQAYVDFEATRQLRTFAADIGYPALNDVTVDNTFSFNVNGTEVDVYNTDHSQNLPKDRLQKAVELYQRLGASRRTTVEQIDDGRHQRPVKFRLTARPVTEYTVVATSLDTPMYAGVDTQGLTEYSADNHQDFSIIQPTNLMDESGKQTSMNTEYVEACQAMVEVSSGQGSGSTLINQLGQETFCNSYGLAALEATSDADYATYHAKITHLGRTEVDYQNKTYHIVPQVLSASAYIQLQTELS